MGVILSQVSLHRIIWEGIQILKANPSVLGDIFEYYAVEPINRDYGVAYIEKIKTWFLTTEIPVVQAWSINPQQAPQISVRLASEQEDESKSAIGDFFGDGEEAEVGTSPFIVNLDILIMAPKNSDEVLWLYHIVNYILFKRKRQAERLGLQLGTFSATDNIRDSQKFPDNIWVRTIKYRCVVQNFWQASQYIDIADIEIDTVVSSLNFEEAKV